MKGLYLKNSGEFMVWDGFRFLDEHGFSLSDQQVVRLLVDEAAELIDVVRYTTAGGITVEEGDNLRSLTPEECCNFALALMSGNYKRTWGRKLGSEL